MPTFYSIKIIYILLWVAQISHTPLHHHINYIDNEMWLNRSRGGVARSTDHGQDASTSCDTRFWSVHSVRESSKESQCTHQRTRHPSNFCCLSSSLGGHSKSCQFGTVYNIFAYRIFLFSLAYVNGVLYWLWRAKIFL